MEVHLIQDFPMNGPDLEQKQMIFFIWRVGWWRWRWSQLMVWRTTLVLRWEMWRREMRDMLKVKSQLGKLSSLHLLPPLPRPTYSNSNPPFSLSLSLKPAVSGLAGGGWWCGVLSYLKLKAMVSITNSPQRVLKLQPERFRESSDNQDTPTTLPYNLTGGGKTRATTGDIFFTKLPYMYVFESMVI